MKRILLFLFVGFSLSARVALGQYGQCDSLNADWFQYYSSDWYPTLQNFCDGHRPQPLPPSTARCNDLGSAFVTYSDAAVMADGSIQAFAASQDMSQYSATAAVQTGTTITMPDGSQMSGGNSSRNGYVMVNISIPVNTSQESGLFTINSQHELNWPGCDGYGTILLTSFQFKIATTKSETNYSDPSTNTTNGLGGVYCGLKSYCTPQTTNPICNPSYTYQQPTMAGGTATCQPYYLSYWLAERTDSSYPWDCFPIPPGNNAFPNYDPALGRCTK